jgi:hypothetical protein
MRNKARRSSFSTSGPPKRERKKWRPAAALRTVERRPGARPPYHALTMTAGMKRRNGLEPPSAGSKASLSRSATATARSATA